MAGCGSGGSSTGTGGAGGSSAGASAGGTGGATGGGAGTGGAIAGTGGDAAGTGGGAAGTGGTGGGVAGTGAGAAGTGGRAGTGGGAAGTGGRGGTGGGTAGTGGGAVAGTGGSARWTCPAGPFTPPNPSSITLTKVAGVPPLDSFNNNGNNFGNIEGDCWFGDALYVSEIASGNNPPPGRILRVTPTGSVSVAFATSGSNGLAIDLMGRLIGASHTAGAVLAFNLTNMTSSPIVSQYMGARLNTPNDLTVRSDGTIYFTDPDFQAPSPRPQAMTRVYRLPPGATAPVVVDAARSNPNGVTLSLDEAFLFVTDGQGLWRYPVSADGSTGSATRIAQSAVGGGGDGMGIDCMGNLYVALQQRVYIVDPTGNGTSLGSISMTAVQSVTNVAFGGANHQTLYVSGLGNGMGSTSMGLYRADMPLPGMPY
ncbi:MAG TPA: SMP-30/gluconolactonase/LRE family protein [Polyangia bacterium]